MSLCVNFMLLHPDARLPGRLTPGSAGCDLYAVAQQILLVGVVYLIPVGIAFEIPFGYEGQIRPRSSMGKRGIIIPNSPGTIDSDYRGEILVQLMSLSHQEHIQAGDRIAQHVIVPVVTDILFIQSHSLGSTERGSGGCGSTGR